MATIESATEIRVFHVEVPEEELDDLRRRLAATRWPRGRPSRTSRRVCSWRRCGSSCVTGVASMTSDFNEVDEGNHFAAWQEPELFTTELRAAFRSLRDETRSSRRGG